MVIILKGHIVATSMAGSSDDMKAESIKSKRMCGGGGGSVPFERKTSAASEFQVIRLLITK